MKAGMDNSVLALLLLLLIGAAGGLDAEKDEESDGFGVCECVLLCVYL